ncbi:kinase-like domain-containing protein [Mycena sanguinolenta]|nr:kinase-like domain-containing protein [Mycena sanguinolenta]
MFVADIRPSNILCNSQGDIKLCDFGLSTELIDIVNTSVGTPIYMSPERIQGATHTIKSNIWSLGITLIELIVEQFPSFDSDNNNSDSECEGERTTPSDHRASLPENSRPMRKSVDVCLEKDGERRMGLAELFTRFWDEDLESKSPDHDAPVRRAGAPGSTIRSNSLIAIGPDIDHPLAVRGWINCLRCSLGALRCRHLPNLTVDGGSADIPAGTMRQHADLILTLESRDSAEKVLRSQKGVKYGIRLLSKPLPRYPFFYVFYMDPSDFSIQAWHLPKPPPNPACETVRIGYGAGGGYPIEFVLEGAAAAQRGGAKRVADITGIWSA